jgi:hypothetical protein
MASGPQPDPGASNKVAASQDDDHPRGETVWVSHVEADAGALHIPGPDGYQFGDDHPWVKRDQQGLIVEALKDVGDFVGRMASSDAHH